MNHGVMRCILRGMLLKCLFFESLEQLRRMMYPELSKGRMNKGIIKKFKR